MGKGLTKPQSYDIIGIPKDERGQINVDFLIYFLNQIDLPLVINQISFTIESIKMLIGKG